MNNDKIKILIVEDHMVARMGIAIIVENTPNFELVGQAQDGQEGVSLALHLKPDVILMDIGLPKIDGIEATRKIKEAKLNSSILMFTSRDSSDDIFAALRAGADGYIMKGSDEKTLKNQRQYAEGCRKDNPGHIILAVSEQAVGCAKQSDAFVQKNRSRNHHDDADDQSECDDQRKLP